MLSLGFGIGRLLGWNTIESIFLGAIICDSSTTIITKALGDLALKKERFAQIILGASIVEDLLAIILIALLTGVGLTGNLQANILLGRIGSLLIFLVALRWGISFSACCSRCCISPGQNRWLQRFQGEHRPQFPQSTTSRPRGIPEF